MEGTVRGQGRERFGVGGNGLRAGEGTVFGMGPDGGLGWRERVGGWVMGMEDGGSGLGIHRQFINSLAYRQTMSCLYQQTASCLFQQSAPSGLQQPGLEMTDALTTQAAPLHWLVQLRLLEST